MTGIYSAAAGMAAQQTWLDALANDLANLNTPGYKSERVAFRDLVYDPRGGGAGAAASMLGASSMQGTIQETDDPLALAIEGPGFFQVKRPDGSLALTRDGAFRVDGTGAIVTGSGDRLAPSLTLPRGVAPEALTVAGDGTVTTADGRKLGTIEIVDVPSPDNLQPIGGGLFAVTAGSGRPVPAKGTIHQRALEASNVDVVDALTSLIEAQRAFQLESRAVSTQDQLLEIANQLRR